MEITLSRRFTGKRQLVWVAGLLVLLVTAIFAVFTLNTDADAQINKDWRSIAIEGYDPVAYFTQDMAVIGSSTFEHRWRDARWFFASADNREIFVANPEKYAPRFGGFCAGAMSLGQKSPIDPEAWLIVDGFLYLNYNKKGRDEMAANAADMIAEAEENWNLEKASSASP